MHINPSSANLVVLLSGQKNFFKLYSSFHLFSYYFIFLIFESNASMEAQVEEIWDGEEEEDMNERERREVEREK